MPHENDPEVGAPVGAQWGRDLDRTGLYTPNMTATDTTNLNVGDSGYADGLWHRNGHHFTVWIETHFEGTGVHQTGSSWRWELPFFADLSVHKAGALATPGSVIGNYKTWSGVAANRGGAVLLYEDNSNLLGGSGKYVILYPNDSGSSDGNGPFAAPSHCLITAQFMADPDLLPT